MKSSKESAFDVGLGARRARFIGFVVVLVIVVGFVVFGMAQCTRRQSQPRYGMQTVTLDDGTQVPCLVYHEGLGQTSVGGISCDWAKAVKP